MVWEATAQLSVLSVSFIRQFYPQVYPPVLSCAVIDIIFSTSSSDIIYGQLSSVVIAASYLDIWSFVQCIFCLEIAAIICADIIFYSRAVYLSVTAGVWKLPDHVCPLVDNSSLDFSRWYFVDCVLIQDKTSLERWMFCTLLDILVIKVATSLCGTPGRVSSYIKHKD